MGVKTRRINACSLIVTREFLEKLGSVIEADSELRKRASEDKIQGLIQEKRKEVAALKVYSKKQKEILLQEKIDHVQKWYAPRYSITYTINSKDEELQFASMRELLDTSVFPQKIESMSFRVTHYGGQDSDAAKYVDISISLSNDYLSATTIKISCEDESKLLRIEKNLKSLFTEFSSSHNWIFLIPGAEYFTILVISGGLTTCAALLLMLAQERFSVVSPTVFEFFTIPGAALLFWLFNITIRYLYPYYDFSMNRKNGFRRAIKGLFWTLVVGMLSSWLYELLNTF